MKNVLKQVERQFYVLSLLGRSREGITVKELHSMLQKDGIDVSARTVRRDLDDLTLANFPIYEEKRGNSTRYMLKKMELRPVPFSINELIGLYFLKELLYPVSSLPVIQDAYGLIFRSIEDLPQPDRKFILSLREHFKIDYLLMDPEENISSEILETLGKGIVYNLVIRASYYSFRSNAVTEREIEPYHLIIKNRHYYLIGYCRERGEVRDFRVSRFRHVELTSEQFNQAPDYSYADYIRHSWHILKDKEIYDIKIRFTPRKARFVKEYERQHADRLKELRDGSLIFCRRVAGLEEVVPWVLSFGGEAEVLSPPELREAVVEHLKKMQSTYSVEE